MIAGASALMVLYYAFCIAAFLFISLLMLIELAGLIVLIRFGGAGIMLRPLEALGRIAVIVIRSLFLGRGREYAVAVSRENAPGLWRMTEEMAEAFGIDPPARIKVTMGDNASAILSGYQTGKGKSEVWIGYDYLAALTVSELQSIIAHELAHARLVRRGYNKLIAIGLARMSNLSHLLGELNYALQVNKKKSYIAEALAKMTNVFGTNTGKLFGAYSRHSEFEADRLAALRCGSEIVGRALSKVELISYKSAEVKYQDRMIQIQTGESFSEWLKTEITTGEDEREEILEKINKWRREDDYSTHPPMAARIEALPKHTGYVKISDEPASSLVADIDGLAEQLIDQIEQTAAGAESEDTAKIIKATKARAGGGRSSVSPLQILGIVLIVLGTLAWLPFVIGTIIDRPKEWPYIFVYTLFILPFIALGVWLCWKCGFKDTVELPLPNYSLWRESYNDGDRSAKFDEWLPQIEAELSNAKPQSIKKKKEEAIYWVRACYQALYDCDYRKAYAAAGLCLKVKPRMPEGLLGMGIAAAYFGQQNESIKKLNQVFAMRNLKNSMPWGLAWATILLGQWDYAEGYLHVAIKQRPHLTMLKPYLARCQWERGKIREAVKTAKSAVNTEPANIIYHTQMVMLYLAAGKPKDAETELEIVEKSIPEDFDVLEARIGVHAMLGRQDAAEEACRRMERLFPGSKTHMRIGNILSSSRLENEAAEYYELALQEAFWPEAYLSLSKFKYDKKDYDGARSLLADSLDLTRECHPGSQGPLSMLWPVCECLRLMEDPVDNCVGFDTECEIPGLPDGLQKIKLLVAAPNDQKASEIVQWLCGALRPDLDPPVPPDLKPIPKEQNPEGVIAPGVYNYGFL